MVEIQILEIKKDRFIKDGKDTVMKLLIKGMDSTFLNALRRFIIEEVPTIAIEDVYVYENSSALWDEFIAHRLGLIPLNTPKDYLSKTQEVKIRLKLEAEGPRWVYASDIVSEDPNVYPVYEKIPIVYLDQGQKIKMEMDAVFGKGLEHAKWEPAWVYYYKLGELKVLKEPSEKEIKILEELGCKYENGKVIIPENKKYDRTFLDAIESINPEVFKVEVKDEYIFVIESFGQYDVKDIIPLACDLFIDKIRKFIHQLIEK